MANGTRQGTTQYAEPLHQDSERTLDVDTAPTKATTTSIGKTTSQFEITIRSSISKERERLTASLALIKVEVRSRPC